MSLPFLVCYMLILQNTGDFIYFKGEVLGEEPLDLKLHRKVIKFPNIDPGTATQNCGFWWNSTFHSVFLIIFHRHRSFNSTSTFFFFFLAPPRDCLVLGGLLEYKHLSEKERIRKVQFCCPSQQCRQVTPVSLSLWKPLSSAAICCSTHWLLPGDLIASNESSIWDLRKKPK